MTYINSDRRNIICITLVHEMRRYCTTDEERRLLAGALMGALQWGCGPVRPELEPKQPTVSRPRMDEIIIKVRR